MRATPRSLRLVGCTACCCRSTATADWSATRATNEPDHAGQLARQLELVHVLPVLDEALKCSPAKRAELNDLRMDEPDAVLDFINWLIEFGLGLQRSTSAPEQIVALAQSSAGPHGSCTHCGKTGHDASACYRRRFADAFADAHRKEFNAFWRRRPRVPGARTEVANAFARRPTRMQRQPRVRSIALTLVAEQGGHQRDRALRRRALQRRRIGRHARHRRDARCGTAARGPQLAPIALSMATSMPCSNWVCAAAGTSCVRRLSRASLILAISASRTSAGSGRVRRDRVHEEALEQAAAAHARKFLSSASSPAAGVAKSLRVPGDRNAPASVAIWRPNMSCALESGDAPSARGVVLMTLVTMRISVANGSCSRCSP
jgi:hypothetical protein